ncbi:hypothetical protein L873DRAFT_1848764 [Choiromyces venosus 120613-1]|uniref:Uncharacterized protein n=1 Tax=Choiromyces venosus 120613-1 TaxID=1336337 RepID=A0A3N4IXG5_9PEZI|nr:hypothetical protein L873DRAFT_1848764 [Choiromyces venosus 120613-1]
MAYLQSTYRERQTDIVSVTQYYDTFLKVLTNIAQHPQNPSLRIVSCSMLSCALIELFREDIWNSLQHDRLLMTNNSANLSDPSQSLCITNLKALVGADFNQFKFIKNYNRHKFHPFEHVTYLWDYDSTRQRQRWSNKHWRTLFQLVCDHLQNQFPNGDIVRHFRQSHFHRFLRHNLIFPQPVNGKFHQRLKDTTGYPQRVWYCAYNKDNQFFWNEKDWECGSTAIGFHNQIVPPPLFYSRNMLRDLLCCIEGNQVNGRRLESLGRQELRLVEQMQSTR